MKKSILTVSFILLTVLTLLADTITIEPCDDMYTDVEHPTTPPTTTQLWVAECPPPPNHFERIMIQYDLNELENATIEDATLHLYRFFSCPQTGTTATNFYAITEEWNEETWDSHTHIQYDSYVWTSYTFSGQGGSYGMWFEVDITALVQEWANSGIENHGFVIRAVSGNKFSKFYSKEYSNPNLHPYLVVNYSPVSISDNLIQETIINLQNYPNPFNPETTISFLTTESTENTELIIYNIKGQIVKTMENLESASPSPFFADGHGYSISWNGKDESNNPVASGIYFYELQAAGFSQTKKMILL